MPLRDGDRRWDDEPDDDKDEPWMKAHLEMRTQWERESSSRTSRKHVWDEFEWELFFQQMDRDSQPVLSYYEKYWNHSDRDRMVEEAVALYYVREGYRQVYKTPRDEEYFREYVRSELSLMGSPIGGFQTFFDAKENSLYQIQAYRFARDFYFQLKAWAGTVPESRMQSTDLQNLLTHACTAYSKVAGAHVMGYHPFTLGGNIALCKRALHYSNRCIDFLMALRDGEFFESDTYLRLDEIGLEARNLLGMYIVDLRDRFYSETR